MKFIMMHLHSKLVSESVTDLMTIQMNSPDIKKFDPKKAIHLWNSSWQRNRRLQEGDVMTNERSDCSSEFDMESHCGSDQMKIPSFYFAVTLLTYMDTLVMYLAR